MVFINNKNFFLDLVKEYSLKTSLVQFRFKTNLVLRMFMSRNAESATGSCIGSISDLYCSVVIESQHRVTWRICQRSPSQHTGSWDRIAGTQSILTWSISGTRESLCPVRVPRIGKADGLWEFLLVPFV